MSTNTEPLEGPHLLHCEEARATLRLGRTKFSSLIQSGELPTVWIGGCQRVRADDLARFIDGLPGRDAKHRRTGDGQDPGPTDSAA